MRKITADYLFPAHTSPIPRAVVVVDDAGKILEVGKREDYIENDLEFYDGILTPGFVNTHCHLELSHMKGLVDTGTTLLPFLQKVVQFRNFPKGTINSAIDQQNHEMYQAGIVAVGDISNQLDTVEIKNKSKIRYYTFVEMFDFMQDAGADATFEQYEAVFQKQSTANGNRKSRVPHAPYTVSKKLFKKIAEHNPKTDLTVSIHNQETIHENELFMQKKGGFLDFYKTFGIPLDKFKATKKTSIHYAMANLNPKVRNLFVHNTMTSDADIKAAHQWSENVYWATCPNANLYIENRLPNYRLFLDNDAQMTIGTDSLTSNWQLSILEEMKKISQYQSYVDLETLIRWATLNGAKALGFDDDLGSIEVGKTPGINLLDVKSDLKLRTATEVRRLV